MANRDSLQKTTHSLFYEMMLCVLFLFAFSFKSYGHNPTPTGNTTQSFCKSNNRTIDNLIAQGTQIEWFDSKTNGNKLSEGTLLENGKTYYADDAANGVSSLERLAVKVYVYENIPTPTGVLVGGVHCSRDQSTISDLNAVGENIEWYSDEFGGVLLDNDTPLEDDTTYYVQQTIDQCSSVRQPTYVTIINPSAPIVTSEQFFCSTIPLTVSALNATGKKIAWYDGKNSTAQLQPSDVLIDGKQYWASQKTAVCESAERVSTTVHINTPPPTPTADSDQNFCAIDKPTVASLTTITGTDIKWYANESDITLPLPDFTKASYSDCNIVTSPVMAELPDCIE